MKEAKENPDLIQTIGSLRDTRQLSIKHDTSELPIFDFDTILAATNDFGPTNKLGQGGFGPVYK
ncbi:Protein kinase-like domain containing protein, partial [Trema orientale]